MRRDKDTWAEKQRREKEWLADMEQIFFTGGPVEPAGPEEDEATEYLEKGADRRGDTLRRPAGGLRL